MRARSEARKTAALAVSVVRGDTFSSVLSARLVLAGVAGDVHRLTARLLPAPLTLGRGWLRR